MISHTHPTRTDRRRGSALLVAIILITVLMTVSLGYLRMATTELRMADHGFMQHALLNLAEAGADEAAWSLIHDDWTGWTRVGNTMVRREMGFDLGNKRTAMYITFVYDYQGAPVIFTEGRSFNDRGKAMVKQVRMELSRRSVMANGMTAKESIRFVGGNAYIDSYNSQNGGYNYLTNSADGGSAGSLSVAVDAVDIGNAAIRGYIATGGAAPILGSNGTVYGDDTVFNDGERIDWSRVATDFYADLPDVEMPTRFTVTATSLALSGGTTTIGTTGTSNFPEVYDLDSLDIASGQTLQITGDVVFMTSGDSDIKGTLEIIPGGKVRWYSAGSITVGGKGVANTTNVPENLAIYGTSSTAGETAFTMHGNGAVTAAIYAPNTDVSLQGGGSSGALFGGVVANEISVNGNYSFHYDEGLADFGGENRSYKVDDWRELADASERLPFQDLYVNAVTGGAFDLSIHATRYSGEPGTALAFITDEPVLSENDPARL